MTKARDIRPNGQPIRHEITPAQALERLRAQGRLPQHTAQEPAQAHGHAETKRPQARKDR